MMAGILASGIPVYATSLETVKSEEVEQSSVSGEQLLVDGNQENISLLADSSSDSIYISFNKNGGNGGSSGQLFESGTSQELSGTAPTRLFYKFLGWSTDKDATEAEYVFGEEYTFETDTELFAVWKCNEVEITGDDPHSYSIETTLNKEGTLFKFTPKRSGYYTFRAEDIPGIYWKIYRSNMSVINSCTTYGENYVGAAEYKNALFDAGYVYYIGLVTPSGMTSMDRDFTLKIDWKGILQSDYLQMIRCYQSLSVTDTGKIGLNFYTRIPDAIDSKEVHYKLYYNSELTTNDTFNNVKVDSTGYIDFEGEQVPYSLYKVTCDVSVTNLGDIIKFEEVFGDFKYPDRTFETSVSGLLAYNVKNVLSYTMDEKQLFKSLLNYGAFSQVFFKKNTENLANYTLSDDDKALNTDRDLSSYAYVLEDNLDGVEYVGSSLVLNSDFTIKHYFRVKDSGLLGNYNVLVNGETADNVSAMGNNTICIRISNITARDLNKAYKVTISNGEDSISLDYSVLSYIEKTVSKSGVNQNLINLVYAISDYEEAFDKVVD